MIRRLIFLVVFGIGVVFGYRAHDYLAKDACLDAGGRWEAALNYCTR